MYHTQLPDNINQEGKMLLRTHATPVSALDLNSEIDEARNPQNLAIDGTHHRPSFDQKGLPLSPATSDSSGPRSPTNTNFNSYHINMSRPAVAHESQIEHKPALQPQNYVQGYFPQHFVPTEKPSTEYWPDVPPMPPVSHYGY